jgi:cobalt-zinc-cadmium efflux system membrane fusion protein
MIPPRLRRSVAAAALLTVGVAVLLAHEGHAPLPSRGATVDPETGVLILTDESRTALDVRSAAVATQPPPETVLAYVRLVAPWRQRAVASSRLPGRVTAVFAQPGDIVEAGQPLAHVTSLDVETLYLERQAAATELYFAQQLAETLRASADAVPGQELLDAESRVRQAENAAAVLRANWDGLGLASTSNGGTAPPLPVSSPVRGTVVRADVAVGKVVQPAEPLFEVVDLSTVWAAVGVLEKDLHRVAVGQPVELRLTAYPGEVFTGTVRVKDLILEPGTGLNTVWAEFTNAASGPPRLLPGMTGEARILLPTETNVRVVPAAAVVDNGVERFVLVEEAHAGAATELRRRNVEVVRRTPEWALVRGGELLPGDRVVTRGAHILGGFFFADLLRLSPEAMATLGVEVRPVQAETVDSVVRVPGLVEIPPDRRAAASAALAGLVTRINVGPAQAVTAGEVVAEVWSLDLLRLQLDLLREHLAVELLEQQTASYRTAGGMAARRRLIDLESNLQAAKNRRESLRQRLRVVGLTGEQVDHWLATRQPVETVPVRAPFAGVVVGFDTVLGQAVQEHEPIVPIHDQTTPLVRAFVAERDLSRVQVGQAARVRFVADPSMVLAGKVVRTAGVLEGGPQAVSVWIELEATTESLRHGQMARVAFVTDRLPPVLAVPPTAIVREGTQSYVFVQQPDGTFDRRAVETGRSDDRFVEVTRGLTVGEPVAVRGAEGLQTAFASVR